MGTLSETTVAYKPADHSKKASAVSDFHVIAQKVGSVDVIVVNAGVYGDTGDMATFIRESLMPTLEVNVLSVLYELQAFLPHAADGAVLLHSSSCVAHMALMPSSGGYPIAKAATLKMRDYIVSENSQIRIISTQPSWTPRELNGYDKNATDSRRIGLLTSTAALANKLDS
jgi:NAD(P)-dependent dehydrogenase (short-subunit alcohol dehydrogenase family)